MNSNESNSNSNSTPRPDLVCFCHGVTKAEILRAIAEGATTHEQIKEKTKASTGCGGCTDEVLRILREELARAGR